LSVKSDFSNSSPTLNVFSPNLQVSSDLALPF
jgi:hypothetical protein